MTTFKKGDIVFITSATWGIISGQPRFAGVVLADPWQSVPGKWITNITGLGDDYRRAMALPDKSTAYGIRVERLELAPVYYKKDKVWSVEGEPADLSFGFVGYAEKGSTAVWVGGLREGWVLNVGEHWENAPSYEDARAKVEKLCK